MRYLQRERKHKKTNANQQNQNLNWKKRSGCDFMKETPEPRFEAWFIKYELEIFLLNINEDMICTIVEGTNEEMRKVHKKDKWRRVLVSLQWYDQPENFGMNIFLQGTFAGLQYL